MYVFLMAVGTILAVFYAAVLMTSGKKYQYMVDPLDPKEYRFCELYTFGFAIMNMTKYKFTGKSETQRRKYIMVLKGNEFAEYYLQVEFAKRVSLTMPLVVLSFILPVFAELPAMCPLLLIISVALFLRMAQKPQKDIEARSEEMLSQFPDVVSKLALLINAGMIMRQAWEKVAYSSDGVIYREMQQVCTDLNNGVSETDAYFEFGSRCVIPEIKKFTSTIIQGIIKGNKELSAMLTEQSSEVWNIKMNLVKRQGDAAVTKLLAPMMLIFIGILIMIIVPIFAGM